MFRALFLLPFGLWACEPSENLGARSGSFSVGDHSLALQCTEGPPPRVVIDAGLGEASAGWQDVVTFLEGVSVCTFDRAGYGLSEAGPEPRTPGNNAADLARLLDAAAVEQPIILVGHSLGGLNAQAFFDRFPDRVRGLILLDPPPRAWLEGRRFRSLWDMAVEVGQELQAQAGAADPNSPRGRMLRSVASEHRGMLSHGAVASGIQTFGVLPLLVVAAGRSNPAFGDSAVAYQEFWVSESEALSERSSRGAFRRLDEVGHNMNVEAPQAVADLIQEFVVTIQSFE